MSATIAERDAMAEAMRQGVRHLLSPVIAGVDDMAITHDLLLGALAGVVECWVCCCNQGAGRERIAEALTYAIRDFVDQASDQLIAGIQ